MNLIKNTKIILTQFVFFVLLFQVTNLSAKIENCTTDCPTCPAGEYQKNCEKCIFKAPDLMAWCEKSDKSRAEYSLLDTSKCTSGSISNNNGVLTCSQPLPGGSYKISCTRAKPGSCTFDGKILTCDCTTIEGGTKNTSIDTERCVPDSISNMPPNKVKGFPEGGLVCILK